MARDQWRKYKLDKKVNKEKIEARKKAQALRADKEDKRDALKRATSGVGIPLGGYRKSIAGELEKIEEESKESIESSHRWRNMPDGGELRGVPAHLRLPDPKTMSLA